MGIRTWMFKSIKSAFGKLPFIHHYPPFNLPFRRVVILSTKRPVDLIKMARIIRSQSNQNLDETIRKLDIAENYLREKRANRRDAANLCVAAVRAICEVDPEIGIEYGRKILNKYPDERGLKTVISHLWQTERMDEALSLLKMMSSSNWKKEKMNAIISWNSKYHKEVSDANETSRSISIKEKSQITSTLTGSHTNKSIKDLIVACILDEFSFNSFKYEGNFIQLSVGNYSQELADISPDMLFIESAWRGKDGLWGRKVGHAGTELLDIIDWCKMKSIPTVFWNKEDPVHFNSFLNVAKLFDYVFTTDIDCIHLYKKALNHERVYLLPFAFQPNITNPIEKFERKDATCFAGAYYKKYPERIKDLNMLLESISSQGDIEIFDRNYGKSDPNYMFPNEYQKFIVGTLPFEKIDIAYKGYLRGLNLNTIKQSQTMFARRVFELVASNTLVISNYSRGVKNFFGDLVVSSDNVSEITSQLAKINSAKYLGQKIRSNALRKVLLEHTYEDRFCYIVSKIADSYHELPPPKVLVVSLIRDENNLKQLIRRIDNQSYTNLDILIILDGFEILEEPTCSRDIEFIELSESKDMKITGLSKDIDFVAVIDSSDFHGEDYLLDMVLAYRYHKVDVITRGSYFHYVNNKQISLKNPNKEYISIEKFTKSRSIIKKLLIEEMSLYDISRPKNNVKLGENVEIFSINKFNYCQDGWAIKDSQIEEVSDRIQLDTGLSQKDINAQAEEIGPSDEHESGEYISAASLYDAFSELNLHDVSLTFEDNWLRIHSELSDDEHKYLYIPRLFSKEELGFIDNVGHFHFQTTPGLRLMLAIVFVDQKGMKIDSALALSNSNMEVLSPAEDCRVKVGIRAYSSGVSVIKSIDLFHHDLSPKKLLGSAKQLILTNHYPSYDDIYRNGFIHSRVENYSKEGLQVDVYKLRSGQKVTFEEYEGVNIISGSTKALRRLLEGSNYSSILIHFLDEEMWSVVKDFTERMKILVWVHGSEIQPWHRRKFNYSTPDEIKKAKLQSQRRMNFWKPLLSNLPASMKLIFVSQYFADEVMEDTEVKLKRDQYEIIHNPIDTQKFSYEHKNVSQRFKILTIRPFASRKYANDLSVKAIIELSKERSFKDFEIHIVGAGKLFKETVKPLQNFENVTLHEGFLNHAEIAELHKEYGIFLTPTRMDSQGVSRDEAMSSGLVPITTSVTAIPEFVDERCGILSPGEDFKSMAQGILDISKDPDLFTLMSSNAAKRVRGQSSTTIIIEKEIALIRGGEIE